MLAGGIKVSGGSSPFGSPAGAGGTSAARTIAMRSTHECRAGIDGARTVGQEGQCVRSLSLFHQRDKAADVSSGEGTAADQEPTSARLSRWDVATGSNVDASMRCVGNGD